MAHLSGSMIYPHATSDVITMSSSAPAKIALGTLASDREGKIYRYVDFQLAFAIGEVVHISGANLATKAAETSRGQIGVVVSTVASSDLAGWVQVYGQNDYTLNNLAVCTTAEGLILSSTTDGYAIVTVGTSDDEAEIVGMHCTAVSTSGTSPTSVLRFIKTNLNFPYARLKVTT